MGSRDNYMRWYERNKNEAREKKRLKMAELRKRHPEKYREHSRRSKQLLKQKVFSKYGNKCSRCGFDDMRALTLDHVLNNGAEERRVLGEMGVYRRSLIDGNELEYQILCMNCQFIKRVESSRQNKVS